MSGSTSLRKLDFPVAIDREELKAVESLPSLRYLSLNVKSETSLDLTHSNSSYLDGIFDSCGGVLIEFKLVCN